MIRIISNPNREEFKAIRAAIRENNGYCPCKLEKAEDTKCMCKEFREQEKGKCHCGAYIKIEVGEKKDVL